MILRNLVHSLKIFLSHNHNVVAEASDGIEVIEKYYSSKLELIFRSSNA